MKARDATEFAATVAREHARCFWLDARVDGGWSSRESIIGWLDDDDVSLTFSGAERQVRRHRGGRSEVVGEDIFVALAEEMRSDAPSHRWVGYFGYSSRPDLPSLADPSSVPDAVWMRPSSFRTIREDAVPGNAPRYQQLHQEGIDEQRYREAFDEVQERLAAGDSYEVNLTYRIEVTNKARPFDTYLRLRAENPAPYAGFVQHDVPGAEAWLLSSSPEQFVQVDGGGRITTRPIKGTLPRSPDPLADEIMRSTLQTHERFRAENLMIVDLLRNDLSVVCRPHTVKTPVLMAVESYAAVHQLVSTVTGVLKPDIDPVDAVRALFPPGSMTGAPKLRTMQIIRDVEDSARGPYAGAFGWVSRHEAELAVIIRSAFTADGQRWSVGTGGGVTVHSSAADELDEARLKASALMRVLVDGPVTDRGQARA